MTILLPVLAVLFVIGVVAIAIWAIRTLDDDHK
jgi:nitrogen fixation-related uncharacterized protein